MTDVAALYVQRGGVYWCRPGVDAWDEKRDARLYAGPWPVVAHPPCTRWCRYAKFVESRTGHVVGDDGGTFAASLESVRVFGGVLEHPAWSLAWAAHGLTAPPARGWHKDIDGGWCCEVAQSAYGHKAQKITWLYYVGSSPPEPMRWNRPEGEMVVGFASNRYKGQKKRLSKKQSSETPPEFADALIALARSCGGAQ